MQLHAVTITCKHFNHYIYKISILHFNHNYYNIILLTELVLSVNRKTVSPTRNYDKFLVFSLSSLELTAVQKTFTLEATVRLGSVLLQHHRSGHSVMYMVETMDVTDSVKEAATEQTELESISTDTKTVQRYLFAVSYKNVSCPLCFITYHHFIIYISFVGATVSVLCGKIHKNKTH